VKFGNSHQKMALLADVIWTSANFAGISDIEAKMLSWPCQKYLRPPGDCQREALAYFQQKEDLWRLICSKWLEDRFHHHFYTQGLWTCAGGFNSRTRGVDGV